MENESIDHLWIKINPYHRPARGHAIYSTFHPDEGGTLYYVIDVAESGFTIQSVANNEGQISDENKVTLFIPYDLIAITNFWIWDRHRENNYEIDDIYSN
jgi:hypothetical protein